MHDEMSFAGCLWGSVCGDAVGLPVEGLAARRARKLRGATVFPALLGSRGFVSDDSEHAFFTANALVASRGDAEVFAREMRRELKKWLSLLPAGVGLATLRAGGRAWLGKLQTGVFSAGNGPCMRAPIIGLWAQSDEETVAFNRISSQLTHTDQRAEAGALAIALVARQYANGRNENAPTALESFEALRGVLENFLPASATSELLTLLQSAAQSVGSGETTNVWGARTWEKWDAHGASGYVLHTVPAALHAIWRNGDDAQNGIEEIVLCGGDTDSTGAIVGAVLGARLGENAFPDEWKQAVADWPRGAHFIEKLAQNVAQSHRDHLQVLAPVRASYFPLLARNIGFASVVLAHGFRRILPPY